jgi:cytochrome c oxidase subunit IV
MSEQVIGKKVYFAVFAALMVLTAATVIAARIDMGPLNTPIAMVIAVTKAILVVLFFMHVRYSSKLTKLMVGAGFLWLGIMIVLTMMDFTSRGWVK